MSTATAPTLDSMNKQIEELTGVVKKLSDTPDYSSVTKSRWEETDETTDIVFTDTPGRGVKDGSYKSAMRRTTLKALHGRYGYKPYGEFKSVGDFIRFGMENRNNLAAIEKRVEQHMEPVLKAVQGMSVRDGESAGVTVIPEFNNQIIDRVFNNDLLSRTDGYTVSGNNMTFLANAETSRADGSRHGGLRGYWGAEGGTMNASKPTFREVSLKLNKLHVVVYLTEELLADTAQAIEQYVVRKAIEEFNFMTGNGLFRGTSVGQMMGFLNAPSLLSIAAEGGQAPDTILTENVLKMYDRFFAPNMGNATWYYNQNVRSQLGLMTVGVGTGGQVIYMPARGLADQPYGELMGRPLMPTEFSPSLGDQGDLALVDFKQMLSITKGGVTQAVSSHIEFLTDQLAIKLTMRIDARPWESAPLTPFQGPTSTQSSFVVLDAR